jgi:DNA-binding CsgD family transcriptional regulator
VKNLLASKSESDRDYSTSMKSLSPRQKQIINLFKEDLTTDQMAERLKYSSSTIKQDIIKIYSVFGVNSRSAVVLLAEKAGLS